MSRNLEISLQKENFILSAGRALYWPAQKALIIADLHLGKTAHFRAHGLAIPATVLMEDLNRLAELIAEFQPQQLIIVGDMFHQKNINTDIEYFRQWRFLFTELEIILIQGNHDKLKPEVYEELNITTHQTLSLQGFQLIHEDTSKEQKGYTMSGHLHPGVILKGKGRQALKLPCFVVGKHQLILPAFSIFTGLYTAYCVNECDFYAIAEESLFKMKG